PANSQRRWVLTEPTITDLKLTANTFMFTVEESLQQLKKQYVLVLIIRKKRRIIYIVSLCRGISTSVSLKVNQQTITAGSKKTCGELFPAGFLYIQSFVLDVYFIIVSMITEKTVGKSVYTVD